MQLISGHACGLAKAKLAKAWLGNVRFLVFPPSSVVIFRSTCFQVRNPGVGGGGWGKLQDQTLQSYLSCFHQKKPDSPTAPKLALIPPHWPFSSKSLPFCTKPSLKTLNKHPETIAFIRAKPPPLLLLHLQKYPQFCHRAKPWRTVTGGGKQLSEPTGLCSPQAEMPHETKRQ